MPRINNISENVESLTGCANYHLFYAVYQQFTGEIIFIPEIYNAGTVWNLTRYFVLFRQSVDIWYTGSYRPSQRNLIHILQLAAESDTAGNGRDGYFKWL